MRNQNDEGTLNPYTVSPDELLEGDVLAYKIVGIVRNGFWEAYLGLTGWTDAYTLAHGDRLTSKEIAETLINAPPRAGLKYYDGSKIS